MPSGSTSRRSRSTNTWRAGGRSWRVAWGKSRRSSNMRSTVSSARRGTRARSPTRCNGCTTIRRSSPGSARPHAPESSSTRAGRRARRRSSRSPAVTRWRRSGATPVPPRVPPRPRATGAALLAVLEARAFARHAVAARAVRRRRAAALGALAPQGRARSHHRRDARPHPSPARGAQRPRSGDAARPRGRGGDRVRGAPRDRPVLQHRRSGARRQPRADASAQRSVQPAATAAESIGAVKVIHALSLEGVFAQAFTGQSRKNLATGVVATRLSAGLERTVDMLIAVATALVLWFGARSALRGVITPGELVVFLTYLRTAFRPMRDFAKYTGRLAKASAAGERVLDLLDRVPDVRDLPGAVPAPPLRGAVRFEAVSFAYEPGRPALDEIACDVQPGELVALMGPSGGGQTTFVSLILRLYDPTAGRVLIDGRDIREYTLASLRPQLSIVIQERLLFAASIRDNIAYGASEKGSSPEAIEAAARLANADAFIRALPQGYDTVIGERGVTLSNGQRQRIAIARAAIRHAPILIFDEPTTGLDRENVQAVSEAIARLAEGRTTFLITHDADLAARAHRILYMEAGRMREQVSPARYDAVNA